MRYDEFLSQVESRAGLASQEEALNITRATLGTLGERIYRSQRADLTSQLPNELKSLLGARTEPETSRQEVDRFPLEEFYNRVVARADMGYPQAVRGVKAVMAVLREAITAGEWDDLRSELSDEYDKILT